MEKILKIKTDNKSQMASLNKILSEGWVIKKTYTPFHPTDGMTGTTYVRFGFIGVLLYSYYAKRNIKVYVLEK